MNYSIFSSVGIFDSDAKLYYYTLPLIIKCLNLENPGEKEEEINQRRRSLIFGGSAAIGLMAIGCGSPMTTDEPEDKVTSDEDSQDLAVISGNNEPFDNGETASSPEADLINVISHNILAATAAFYAHFMPAFSFIEELINPYKAIERGKINAYETKRRKEKQQGQTTTNAIKVAGETETANEKAEMPNLNSIIGFPNRAILHNIGVCHTVKDFEKEWEVVLSGIDNSEIVLLEYGDAYFPELEWYSLTREKETICIDPVKNYYVKRVLYTGETATGFMHVYNLTQFRDLLNPVERKMWMIRAALAWVGEALFGMNISSMLKKKFKDKYTWPDMSLITDGRTVAMTRDVLRLVEENPGKRIAVITGNNHARGIEFYLQHPEIFKVKLAIYEKTFGKLEKSSIDT